MLRIVPGMICQIKATVYSKMMRTNAKMMSVVKKGKAIAIDVSQVYLNGLSNDWIGVNPLPEEEGKRSRMAFVVLT